MAETLKPDDIEKLLSDQKAIDARKESLIEALLKQKEAAIKEFDEKLAKLEYQPNSRTRRSHHKKTAPAAADSKAAAKSEKKGQ